MDLSIYRGGPGTSITVKIDENTKLEQELLGKDIVSLRQVYPDVKDIQIGDYITVDSRNYYVNSYPTVEKNSCREFRHEVTFEALWYDLTKVQLMLSNSSDFDLMGDLETFIDLIVTNMNRIFAGWSKGSVTNSHKTEYKHLAFSGENCLQVLQRLADEYDGEFSFSTKAINFVDEVGSATGLSFECGKGKGLAGVSRNTVTNENIVTRLYAFGSTRNIDSSYRSGKQRLEFSDGGNNYLEKNTGTYGTIEHTALFDDIYPHREGSISSLSTASIFEFNDSAMDFNVNTHLLSGISAKLHFQTGNLGGYTFEMTSYNTTRKRFEVIQFEDDHGNKFPNTTIHASTGDKYTLLDIIMPTTYIAAAESTLQAEAQAYLDDNCEPTVEYNINPDWRYFKAEDIELEVGDQITITDNDLSINVTTRIVSLTKCPSSPYKYTLKVANKIRYSLVQRLYAASNDSMRRGAISDIGNIEKSQGSWNYDRGTLTAKRIQTDTGMPGHFQRIVLNRDDNTLRFYDSSNNNIITIDDNILGLLPGMQIDNGMIYFYHDGDNYISIWASSATNAGFQIKTAGSTPIVSVESNELPSANPSYGSEFEYYINVASAHGKKRYALRGISTISNASNNDDPVAIYGDAQTTGSGVAYAGFFDDGKVYIKNELELDGDLNHDGSNVGFFGVAPAARSTGWTLSNVVADKTLDCDSFTTQELAHVICTLINYLITIGLCST